MTAQGGRLLVCMGTAVTGAPQPLAAGLPYSAGKRYLVCLDLAAQGKLLQRIEPEEGWAFEGSPVCEGDNVYVAMRRNEIRPQAHVACFDVQSGRLRWRRFICAAETPARGMLPECTHNLLTLHHNTLYINTNLGAVAAVRADDGRVLWVSLYPRERRGDLNKLAPHWRRDPNPCVYHRGTLLVAPADSPRILALDAFTGQILWQTGTELEDVTDLLGTSGDWLIASGGRLYRIGLKDENRGHVEQLWPNGTEKPGYGRGLLTSEGVLFPTREKIYLFDAKTAQPKKQFDLRPRGVTGGNLLLTGDRLLIVTGTELVALSAMENRRLPETHDLSRGAATEHSQGLTPLATLCRPFGTDASRSITPGWLSGLVLFKSPIGKPAHDP
jgi:hypothetical protein